MTTGNFLSCLLMHSLKQKFQYINILTFTAHYHHFKEIMHKCNSAILMDFPLFPETWVDFFSLNVSVATLHFFLLFETGCLER